MCKCDETQIAEVGQMKASPAPKKEGGGIPWLAILIGASVGFAGVLAYKKVKGK